MVSLICATSRNGVIGIGNRLPWRLPADLKRFKILTMNHPILMGRKTFESIGKPLPGRTNIVVTRQEGLVVRQPIAAATHRDFKACGALVAHTLEEAFRLGEESRELFVIGGAQIFKQALPFADKIYLTLIDQDFEGDVKMFEIDKKIWKESSREDFGPDAANPYRLSFITYERARGQDAV